MIRRETDPEPSTEEIGAFVEHHMQRNPQSDETYVQNGFRVRFGRRATAAETAALHRAYVVADQARTARLAAEAAAAEARKPKGFDKVLAMNWQMQSAVGTTLFVAGLYAALGIEQASYAMFWIVGVTQGLGLFPLAALGWAIGNVLVRALRAAFRYSGPAAAVAFSLLVDTPVPELAAAAL